GTLAPAAPSVTHTYATALPARVQKATVPADPNSASSGWAKTTLARSNTISRADYPTLVQPPSEQGKRLGQPPSLGTLHPPPRTSDTSIRWPSTRAPAWARDSPSPA